MADVSSPSVSIIIAAADASASLPRTLDSIDGQTYEGPLEVVIATADRLSADAAGGRALVVDNPSGRTPTGLNLAAAQSTGEILVRLDAHATIPSDYVTRVVDTLMRTGADNVGGMQVPRGRTLRERAIALAMSSPFGAGDATYRIGGPAGPADTVYLGAFRRATFDRLGGYDERYVRHQDYELNHRIRAEEGTVWFSPELKVEYLPRPSLAALAIQYFQYGRWKRRFGRANPGSLQPRQLAPPLLVVTMLASFVGALAWPWLLLVPASYALALVAIGIFSLPRAGLPALLMPAALAVMHFSWGSGFLFGQRSER